MKKSKILIPLLSSCAIVGVATPVITSCTNSQLAKAKADAKGKIEAAAMEAMAREPEHANEVTISSNFALSIVDQCTNASQAEGAGYASTVPTAIGRQPEAMPMIMRYLKVVSQVILLYPDDRALAIGRAAGMMYEGMGRQPEAAGMLFSKFILYTLKVIEGK